MPSAPTHLMAIREKPGSKSHTFADASQPYAWKKINSSLFCWEKKKANSSKHTTREERKSGGPEMEGQGTQKRRGRGVGEREGDREATFGNNDPGSWELASSPTLES